MLATIVEPSTMRVVSAKMFKNHSLRNTFRFVSGNILVLSVTGMLGNTARRMVLPYVSLYILALGGDATIIGLVNSLSPLAGLVIFPIAGYLAQEVGYPVMYRISAAAATIGLAVFLALSVAGGRLDAPKGGAALRMLP